MIVCDSFARASKQRTKQDFDAAMFQIQSNINQGQIRITFKKRQINQRKIANHTKITINNVIMLEPNHWMCKELPLQPHVNNFLQPGLKITAKRPHSALTTFCPKIIINHSRYNCSSVKSKRVNLCKSLNIKLWCSPYVVPQFCMFVQASVVMYCTL